MRWKKSTISQVSEAVRLHFKDAIILSRELSKRGLLNYSQFNSFLYPEAYQQTSPFEFLDMEKCVRRIFSSIDRGKKIGIWGDFDVDGQTSTAILVDGLRKYGAMTCFHIPIRASESHGVNLQAFERFLDEHHPDLVITCDTGISENASIEFANANGVDVIITDHHKLPQKLPPAYAIINPHQLTTAHPLSYLAGVGTAFQVIRALTIKRPGNLDSFNYYDLVALGTIADLAEQQGENRYYTQMGLIQLNKELRTSLASILQISNSQVRMIDESTIGFYIAPRLNASGRLSDANPNVQFLLSANQNDCLAFAKILEDLNNKRKIMVDNTLHLAEGKIEANKVLLRNAAIVLMDTRWESGVLGIAAGVLAEKYNRPVLLLRQEGDFVSGSARSIRGFDITSAIADQQHLLKSFGGHATAGGLRMATKNFELFKTSINKSIKDTFGDIERPLIEIDHFLSFSRVDHRLLHELNLLAPFGPGNPAPLFASTGLDILQTRVFGNQNKHHQLSVRDKNGDEQEITWWNAKQKFSAGEPVDIAYHIVPDNYRGNDAVNFLLVDIKPAEHKKATSPDLIETTIQIEDYRLASDPIKKLTALTNSDSQLQVWYEGVDKLPTIPNCLKRCEINVSKSIALLIAPPDRQTLQTIVRASQAEKVYLFDICQKRHSAKPLLLDIGRMLKYYLKQQPSEISFEKIAAHFNLTQNIVKLCINWFQAHGDINIIESADKSIQIENGNGKSIPHLSIIQKKLNKSLKEMTAFQDYYHNADPNLLIN